MGGFMPVPGGVAPDGAVAAADVPAIEAHTQMDPAGALAEAVFAGHRGDR